VVDVVEQVLDVAGLVAITLGCLVCLTTALGMLRFPDLLTRMHAATKPQVLGVLLVLLGVGLRLRTDLGLVALVALFQLLTIPVAAFMVARAARQTDLPPTTDD
jgi:multicomponent Na+:H+ antiporter subunit G